MGDLIESVLAIFLASPLMAFSVNFIVIHSWFNFTGEMTRFGDREFYQVRILVITLVIGGCYFKVSLGMVVGSGIHRILPDVEYSYL